MAYRPLIIGEAPGKNENMPRPIEGRVGKRLADACDMPMDEFLSHFDRVNLLHVRQDTKEKGFEFDAVAAAHSAQILWYNEARFGGRIILLLGKRVALAFGAHERYFEEQRLGSQAYFYVLPHPSGVNRWFNNPDNKRALALFMQTIVERTR